MNEKYYVGAYNKRILLYEYNFDSSEILFFTSLCFEIGIFTIPNASRQLLITSKETMKEIMLNNMPLLPYSFIKIHKIKPLEKYEEKIMDIIRREQLYENCPILNIPRGNNIFIYPGEEI